MTPRKYTELVHPNRKYDAYITEMNAALEQKFQDILPFIHRGGAVYDDGCGDGSLLRRIAGYMHPRWDGCRFVGVDGSREMLRRAAEAESPQSYHNKGMDLTLFCGNVQGYSLDGRRDHHADFVVSSSVMHEIWSYGSQEESVRLYLSDKFNQLRRGGRLIIRDVVGPENNDEAVRLILNNHNGVDLGDRCKNPALLSTHGLFRLFLRSFKPDGRLVEYKTTDVNTYELRLQDAAEFILKLPYTDQWWAEIREEFCFWSFSKWCTVFADEGFKLLPGSRQYTNTWRVDNHFAGRFTLTDLHGEPLAYPPTNMVLVGEKR